MVETAVEIAHCKACGAEVRDESLFCYNCGASVSQVKEPEDEKQGAPSNSAVPSDAAAERGDRRPPLRSAASLRKNRRAYNRQPVKVSWEPPPGSPKAFIVTTIVFALAATVLLVLAFYLR